MRLWRTIQLATIGLISVGMATSSPVVARAAMDATTVAMTDVAVTAVSAGQNNTCAIRVDGTIACWGEDEFGESTPPAGTFKAVAGGSYYGCAIATDGTLACWGTHADVDTWAPAAGTVKAVSVGEWSACAVKTDNTIGCWGDNRYGQLEVPAGTYTAVSVGRLHACAIRAADGSLACWGYDYYGQADPPAGAYLAVAAGYQHSCGISIDGTLHCWGGDGYGQVTPPPGTFASLSSGGLFTCAIRADGTIACWGLDQFGQATPPAGVFESLSAWGSHACAMRADGTFTCWGNDQYGMLTPAPTPRLAALPTWLATTTLPLDWEARPALAAVTSYDVRYRRAKWNGDFGSRVIWRSGTTATSATFTASPGYTVCFSVRASDASGAVSAWTIETCTAIPLDDRSLSRSASWAVRTGTPYYRSTYLRSSSLGARLTRPGVVARQIALVATTCPTCGTVKVYLGTTLLKTVSLYSDTTVNRRLIRVKTFDRLGSGTLTIKVVSSGKKVIVDGVAIRRNWS